MIRSFRHDGIERFFRTGSMAGIQPKQAVESVNYRDYH
jgi:plasmid maintenance system killer protein